MGGGPGARRRNADGSVTLAAADGARPAAESPASKERLAAVEMHLGPAVLTAVAGLFSLAGTHADLLSGPGLADRVYANSAALLPFSELHARYLSGRPRVPPMWTSRCAPSSALTGAFVLRAGWLTPPRAHLARRRRRPDSHRYSLLGSPRNLSIEAFERQRQSALDVFTGNRLRELLPSVAQPIAAGGTALVPAAADAATVARPASGTPTRQVHPLGGAAGSATPPRPARAGPPAAGGMSAPGSAAASPALPTWSFAQAAQEPATGAGRHAVATDAVIRATAAPAAILPLALTAPGGVLAQPPFALAVAVPPTLLQASSALLTTMAPETASAAVPALTLQRVAAAERRLASQAHGTAPAPAPAPAGAAAALENGGGPTMRWVSLPSWASGKGGTGRPPLAVWTTQPSALPLTAVDGVAEGSGRDRAGSDGAKPPPAVEADGGGPGRLQVRVPRSRHQPSFSDEIGTADALSPPVSSAQPSALYRTHLSPLAPVRSVEAPTTGSAEAEDAAAPMPPASHTSLAATSLRPAEMSPIRRGHRVSTSISGALPQEEEPEDRRPSRAWSIAAAGDATAAAYGSSPGRRTSFRDSLHSARSRSPSGAEDWRSLPSTAMDRTAPAHKLFARLPVRYDPPKEMARRVQT